MAQLSHPYMTTGKTIALTRWTFVGKVMSLLCNVLSWFVISSLPRSKHLLISQLQSLSTVILEPKKIKSVTVSISSASKLDLQACSGSRTPLYAGDIPYYRLCHCHHSNPSHLYFLPRSPEPSDYGSSRFYSCFLHDSHTKVDPVILLHSNFYWVPITLRIDPNLYHGPWSSYRISPLLSSPHSQHVGDSTASLLFPVHTKHPSISGIWHFPVSWHG